MANYYNFQGNVMMNIMRSAIADLIDARLEYGESLKISANIGDTDGSIVEFHDRANDKYHYGKLKMLMKCCGDEFMWVDRAYVEDRLKMYRDVFYGDPAKLISKLLSFPGHNMITIMLLVSLTKPDHTIMKFENDYGETIWGITEFDCGEQIFDYIFFEGIKIMKDVIKYKNGIIDYTELPEECAQMAKHFDSNYDTYDE